MTLRHYNATDVIGLKKNCFVSVFVTDVHVAPIIAYVALIQHVNTHAYLGIPLSSAKTTRSAASVV